MHVPGKFAEHAALLLARMVPSAGGPEQPDFPDERKGGRLPQLRGPAVYGTDSRPPYNGTASMFWGMNTGYYGPI